MSSLHTAEKLLYDVLSASKSIQEFTQNLDEESFQSNELVQSACERKFEIIGEALNRLKRYFPKVAEEIPEIEKIVGFRNIIAHGYDIVDSEIVWETIQLYVPKLVKNIEKKYRLNN
ncbi:MAG: HepT-like ribonuclease domain-containing protein [Candidatus Rifleibacteriota bacterium]